MMRWLAALIGFALTMLLGLALVLTSGAESQGMSGECSLVLSDQRAEELTPEQVSNARIIVGVGLERGVPQRGLVIAVATAQQESGLRNLTHGDRDSIGLLQQRPSAGWGTVEQIRDPVYAAIRFYQALEEVPGWELLPLTVAAQAVQRSAYPDAYAQWETMAAGLVAAVTSTSSEALTCPVDDHMEFAESSRSAGQWPPEEMGPDGLTPRTRTAMRAVMHAFGVTSVGGFCPGGCRTGHIEGSDHYTGQAVDFMLTPINEENRELGDTIAAWLVANADQLAVKYIIWNERIWSRDRAGQGWRNYTHPSGNKPATPSPTETTFIYPFTEGSRHCGVSLRPRGHRAGP